MEQLIEMRGQADHSLPRGEGRKLKDMEKVIHYVALM